MRVKLVRGRVVPVVGFMRYFRVVAMILSVMGMCAVAGKILIVQAGRVPRLMVCSHIMFHALEQPPWC